jgi:hypothetical protein
VGVSRPLRRCASADSAPTQDAPEEETNSSPLSKRKKRRDQRNVHSNREWPSPKLQPLRIGQYRFNFGADIGDRLAAPFDVFFEATPNQVFDSRVHVKRQYRQVRLARENGRDHFGDGFALERLPSHQHLVQQRAERKDVAALIRIQSFCLFGRHVRRGAQNHTGIGGGQAESRRAQYVLRFACRSERLGKSEIENLDLSFGRDFHVRRFEVAMDDVLRVRKFKRFRNLVGDLQRVLDGNRTMDLDRDQPGKTGIEAGRGAGFDF